MLISELRRAKSKLKRILRPDSATLLKYVHTRLDLDAEDSEFTRSERQIINLVNYTKTSGSEYDAAQYQAGYHTIVLNGKRLQGQRDPRERLASVPYDFNNKCVLDIGCNQGGMLFEIADRIHHGVGIDFDSRMINAANRIRSYTQTRNLDFYVFDLEAENLEIIYDFLPKNPVDIAFLLSVCMWIRNWREVIDFTREVAHALLFESNGSDQQQQEQEQYLKTVYRNVSLLQSASHDDPRQTRRRLYLCS